VGSGKLQLSSSRQQQRNRLWPDNDIQSRILPFKQPPVIRTTTRRSTTTTTTTTSTTTVPTTTTTTTSTTVPTTRIIEERQFSPLIIKTEKNPYLSIDMDRFAVIPAVPGVPGREVEGRTRGAKTTGLRESEDILAGFSPVPAVPAVPAVPTPLSSPRQEPLLRAPPSRQPVSVVTGPPDDNSIQGGSQVTQKTTSSFYQDSEPSEQRKSFKKCHGKCVQKFCLPIEDLNVYDSCSEKCKGICKQ